MSNNQLSQRISRYAAAERLARTCQMQGRAIPDAVIQELQSGAAVYASVPASVRASIDNELNTARMRIEHDIIQQRHESEQRAARADAETRNNVFERFSKGMDAETTRKVAAGEKAIPNTSYKTDARGNRTKVIETRKPSVAEQRRAQIVLAAERAGWVDQEAKERREGGLDELKSKTHQNSKRYHDIATAYDATDAVAQSEPAVDYGEPGESIRETATRTWDSLSPATESQESN